VALVKLQAEMNVYQVSLFQFSFTQGLKANRVVISEFEHIRTEAVYFLCCLIIQSANSCYNDACSSQHELSATPPDQAVHYHSLGRLMADFQVRNSYCNHSDVPSILLLQSNSSFNERVSNTECLNLPHRPACIVI
jgi:hypothetical protein